MHTAIRGHFLKGLSRMLLLISASGRLAHLHILEMDRREGTTVTKDNTALRTFGGG